MRFPFILTISVSIVLTLVLTYLYDQESGKRESLQYPQFVDNGNGTVTDNRSGLIWLKNTNCAGEKTWEECLAYCKTLAEGTCDLSDSSTTGIWRLPTRKEFESLLDPGNFSPVLPNGHPFKNVKDGCYWLYRGKKSDHIYLGSGGVGLGGINLCYNRSEGNVSARFHVLPVR